MCVQEDRVKILQAAAGNMLLTITYVVSTA